ncbi:hypothetical protein LTS08_002713 [Lithohypha guttulata]|nr:hypothetical protein LTS08_002713 [Lithohypha guttulata]
MVEDDSEQRPAKRRRVLACDTCRRLKNRCEYDASIGKCTRCRRLRLECSLRPSSSDIQEAPPYDSATNLGSIEEKLGEHSVLLNDIRDIVQRIQVQSQSPQQYKAERPRSQSLDTAELENGNEEDQSVNNPAADRNTTSAPVNLIRNRFSALSGLARLARNSKDVVELGLLSERQALTLQELFFQRIGPWIGITNWNAISEARDVRRISPLLFAAICLQGARLDPSFCNTVQHDQLYEHVRTLTGRELLICPLPLESVCALLILAIWSTSPKEKAEFIDSWLMSGYAVQQAKLSINFTSLLKHLNEGRADHVDQRRLRLWNMICLCHLQFAVGTGRPSVIAPEYLEHCPSILNTIEATVYDGISVATLQLFAIVQDLLKHNNLTEDHSRRHLKSWTNKWGHLLDANDHRVCVLQMAIDFCHLVLDRRCLDHLNNSPSPTAERPTTSPNDGQLNSPSASSRADRSSLHNHGLRERYFLLCKEHAMQLLLTFKSLPPTTSEEVPEFLHLCVVYAMIVLAELYKEQPHDPAVPNLIRETLAYGQQAVSGTTISFEVTKAALGEFLGNTDIQTHQQHLVAHAHNHLEAAPAPTEMWDLPQMEDLFSGAFATDNYRWYG